MKEPLRGQRYSNIAIGIFLLSLALLSFQNCGGFKAYLSANISSISLGKSGISECDDNILNSYSSSIQVFGQDQKCTQCHSLAGSNAPTFVNSDVSQSFNAFNSMGGIEILSRTALSNHQSGFTGAHLKDDIENLKQSWSSSVQNFYSCVESNNTDTQPQDSSLISTSMAKLIGLINITGEPVSLDSPKTMTWNFDESDFSPQIPGGFFQLDITVKKDSSNKYYYEITNPAIAAGSKNMNIEKITIIINDLNNGKTTYNLSISDLNANSRMDIIASAVIFSPNNNEFMKSNDKIKIEFTNLKESQ